jgi:allantoinase
VKIFRSKRVITPEGVRAATVYVEGGVITKLGEYDDTAGGELIDAGEHALMPGVVDTHVHLNEPGRTEWEGFATATQAAAAGGVTTLVDMPLNSIPPTTTRRALAKKREAATGQCAVDVGFWGGVVPGNKRELAGLVKDGVRGFKCFLIDSGVPEFGWVAEKHLRPAMEILAKEGVPLLCHAEIAGPIDAVADSLKTADPHRYATWLASRPEAAEEEAIGLLVRLCEDTGCRTHIVHHSAAAALPLIAEARADGLPLSAETCPHYLHFTAEAVPGGATAFKCAPPIRSAANRELLWRALTDGVISMVASDHSPCSPSLKALEAGDFVAAWGGVAGLQLSLSVLWTEARWRGHTLAEVARWMSAAPAALAGLEKKGAIFVGRDADLVIFDDDASFDVKPSTIRHKHAVTPYAGEKLFGVVAATYLRGERVFDGTDVRPDHGALL